MNYKVIEVQVRRLTGPRVPPDLGEVLQRHGDDGWNLVQVIPVLDKGLLGGSYTESILIFFSKGDAPASR